MASAAAAAPAAPAANGSSRKPTKPAAKKEAAAAPTNTTASDNDADDGGVLSPWLFLGVGLLVGVVGLVALFARSIDMWKPLPPRGLHPAGFRCQTLGREEFIGVEDLVLVSSPAPPAGMPRVLLGGSDDRLRLWEHPMFGPAKTPQGSLLAVYDHGAEDVRLERLALAGFPADVAFHPHGLHYHRESQKLFVVNHAYAKGGERIDVFRVLIGGADGKASVSWLYEIAPLLFQAEAMGTLNDVIVLDAGAGDRQDELYVTQYRPFPDPLAGRLAPGSILSRSHDLLTALGIVLKKRWTRIIYCKGALCRPTSVAEGMGAGQQAHGGVAYNGISLSPDKQRLLVADMKSVHIFSILAPTDADASDGGPSSSSRHRLRRLQLLSAPHLVDNIEAVAGVGEDEEEETYSLGSVGHIFQFLQHNHIYGETASGEREPAKLNITGGVQLLTRDAATGRYGVKEVFLADGSGLSGVSAAVRLPGGAERYLLGSWSDRGVLLCTRTGIKGQPGGKEEL